MLDPNGIDAVIPLGRGSPFRNAELRYCLRSLERHAKGIQRVVIVGNDPKFLSSRGVKHVHCPYFDTNKEARIALKVLWAFQNVDLSDEILFLNDDYVFLQAFDAKKVRPYQKGPLSESARPREGKERTTYQKTLLATHEALKGAKLPAWHYDLHVPIRYRRDKFVALQPWWDKSRSTKDGLVAKSLYGNNVFKPVPGPRWTDLKTAASSEADILKKTEGRWVFSYSDRAMYGGLEKVLHSWFPDKSRFEI